MPPALRLVALVAISLVAFAANSVLCRLALVSGPAGPAIGPGAFTAIRIASGAAALLLLLAATGRLPELRGALSPRSAAALFVYAAAFSFAYLGMGAGLGALILFGAVQATMFGGALIGGERPGPARWLGAAAALAGLAVLALPGADAPPLRAALLMAVAGAAWGVYSLLGRAEGRPTPRTAAAFLLATPAALLLWATWSAGPVTPAGVALAVASGALASGGGYAVWYRVLPRLDASLAGVAQLLVPLIALGGGAAFLGESLTARFALAALLILGGVGAATFLGRRARG